MQREEGIGALAMDAEMRQGCEKKGQFRFDRHGTELRGMVPFCTALKPATCPAETLQPLLGHLLTRQG